VKIKKDKPTTTNNKPNEQKATGKKTKANRMDML